MEGVRVGGIQSCNTRALKYRYRTGNGLWAVFVAITIAKPLRITSDFFTIQGNNLVFVNDSLEIERKGGFVNSDVIAKESTKHASDRLDSALVLYKTQKIAPGARETVCNVFCASDILKSRV